MRLKILIDGQDFSGLVKLETTEITTQIDGRVPLAKFEIWVDGDFFPFYDVVTYGNASYALLPPEQQSEVIIENADTQRRSSTGW